MIWCILIVQGLYLMNSLSLEIIFLSIHLPDCCVLGFGKNKKIPSKGKIYEQITSIALIRDHKFVYNTTGHHHLILQVTLGNFSNKMCDFSIKWTKRIWPPPKKSLAANHLTFQNKNWCIYLETQFLWHI